jgi:hypothetical protein
MARSLNTWVAAALALTLVAAEARAQTQTPTPAPHPRHSHRVAVVHPGDIVVHARRSYLDPGPTGSVGTGNRYVGDTTPYSFNELGPTFGLNSGGFELLPRMFNPPGRPEPLFQF